MLADAQSTVPARYRIGGAALVVFAWITLFYLVLPQFIVVPLSFSDKSFLSFPPTGWSGRWYAEIIDNPGWLQAMLNSLFIGFPAAALSMVLGTLVALAVARGEFVRAGAISALVVAPMMLPHVILAIGLYPVLLGMGLLGSHLAAIIGHTVIGFPLVFITVTAALARHNFSLELAAMTLGATPWRTFWLVTFPMIRISVLIGGILAFATSVDELMLALFLTGAGTRTLPRLIWEQMNDYLTPTIAAVATLVFLLTLALLMMVALLQWHTQKKSGKAT